MEFLLIFSGMLFSQWHFNKAADKKDVSEILKTGAVFIGCMMLLCSYIICDTLLKV